MVEVVMMLIKMVVVVIRLVKMVEVVMMLIKMVVVVIRLVSGDRLESVTGDW